MAEGRPVKVKGCNREITKFIFAKEFGWTPDQVDNMSYKDYIAMSEILSVYNKVMNREMEKSKRKK